MENLLLKASDVRNYLIRLVQGIRSEKERVQKSAPVGSRVNCAIAHTVIFSDEGLIENAQIKYSLSNFSEGKLLPPTYETKELINGENYDYSVINDLIQSATNDCNMTINMFNMNGEIIYSDDINNKIHNFIIKSLQSIGVDDGFSVSVVSAPNCISQITIMVS